MNGLMMDSQLTITSIMTHAERAFADREIVSVTHDNPLHRYTYGDAFTRARQLANVLKNFNLNDGDRVATLAWNDYRHFELYYAISCSGFVCHTINPRLFPEQIAYIINHAKDKVIFTDPMFFPLIEAIGDHLTGVEAIVVLAAADKMPATKLSNVFSYEELITAASSEFEWPDLDENKASSLCYTSGTTGNPKGVLYSHRSSVLHAMVSAFKDILGSSSDDVILPVVPMFHVNAWGIVFSAPMMGSKLVLPGPKMGDGKSLTDLINGEQVTFAAGVPTIWLELVNYLKSSGETIPSLERTNVGGAACPLSIMKDLEAHGVWTRTGWGMTETSPLGVANTEQRADKDLAEDLVDKKRQRAGRKIYGVDLRIVDEAGNELPWDGESAGELHVRGPWVANAYYELDNVSSFTDDGWFITGDVGVIEPDGYLSITDRTKDVIKSGGEWISSIDVENAAMSHPHVLEAAVIGVKSTKWTERPLLIVVAREGVEPDKDAILASLTGKVAKWWIPEDCVFIDEIPHSATGKVSKKDLRERYSDYVAD